MEIDKENNPLVNNPEIIALIHQAKKGDEKAFKILMKKFYRSVYFLIFKIVKNEFDAEDVTIEVFTKVFYNLDMYTETHSFSTWLFKIASNHAIDFLRKQKYTKTHVNIDKPLDEETNWYIDLPSDNETPEKELINKQNAQTLKDIIEVLPEDIKEIIILRFIEEMSYKEIAKKVKQPIGTVKARIFRGRNLLMSMLRKSI